MSLPVYRSEVGADGADASLLRAERRAFSRATASRRSHSLLPCSLQFLVRVFTASSLRDVMAKPAPFKCLHRCGTARANDCASAYRMGQMIVRRRKRAKPMAAELPAQFLIFYAQ